MKLSKVKFAQQASYISKNAAAWASDCLDLIDIYPDMRPEDVFRFTEEMRARLANLDGLARAALEASHDR
ncbi:hypothetical protein [Bosea sp. AS-1]|uniref:hypothetical protein n=1 Tax=Bosea sp. AS-1 TaxID=2015316 RepID=UPI000B77D747|nr:hypothetical protein [Bosea sp. AS-1]